LRCKDCFVTTHRNNPFHWADVWNDSKGFFQRHNLAALGYPLELGHHGHVCPTPRVAAGFIVMAENGSQTLRVNFCGHASDNSSTKLGYRVSQLLAARLFPCSFTEPKSAISFNALRQFQILHAESKVAAFDFCGALRRMSDNAFTANVPDLYENFMRCSRMWAYLTTLKRTGQAHGIDKILVHRPVSNVVLYCPSCPEPGFNMDNKMLNLPKHLRHLNQGRDTVDGNFHCTKSTKNSDPKDYSLYQGSGFFPSNSELEEHLAHVKRVPITRERSTCNYLKAVNNQDKKKFKNMEITGIVNVQCSHVFVKASVDLQFSERYANVDLALAQAIRQYVAAKHVGDVQFIVEFESVDRVGSYDVACVYSVNVVERFMEYFPDLVPIVKKIRWAVPALHIQGHQANCMYEFGTCYMEATGHFHGETAEVYWPELNQIGTQVTQQSRGHRQDTIMLHHNDWNYKKTVKACSLLLDDLRRADVTFEKHQKHYLGLCSTYAGRIIAEDREPDCKDRKYTKSVYRHMSNKVPTLTAIYERMLEDEAAIRNSTAPHNKVAAFIRDSILIQEDQCARKLGTRLKAHFTETMKKEIDVLRTKIENAIVKWRKTQRVLAPALEDHLAVQKACVVESELLGLPSELTSTERLELKVEAFSTTEADLREGTAFEAINLVKVTAKALLNLRDRKKKNDSGVYKNTISQKQINDTEQRRDLHIASYMASRDTLIKLGRTSGEDDFPALEDKDTFMKSRTLRRQLGDSRFADGTVWTQASISAGGQRHIPAASTSAGSVAGPSSAAATQPTVSTTAPRKEGWIWTLKPGKMTEAEFDDWTKEGDKVQWFRAEAEMERWREQIEMKLAEWRTTMWSFAKYRDVWTELAKQEDPHDIGYIAYATQQAAIFEERGGQGRALLTAHPTLSTKYGPIEDENLDLVNFVSANRARDKALEDEIFTAYRATQNVALREDGVDEDEDADWRTVDGSESEEDEEEAAEEVDGEDATEGVN
ncbi:hypothetical protein K438DRAFT_1640334, partial [Mycena galopus ATCC 62051]